MARNKKGLSNQLKPLTKPKGHEEQESVRPKIDKFDLFVNLLLLVSLAIGSLMLIKGFITEIILPHLQAIMGNL